MTETPNEHVMPEYKIQLLKFFAQHDLCMADILLWDENLNFYILCNDLFVWASADAEPIESDSDIQLITSCYEVINNICKSVQVHIDYNDVFTYMVCRKRNEQPQQPMYNHIPKYLHHLFKELPENNYERVLNQKNITS